MKKQGTIVLCILLTVFSMSLFAQGNKLTIKFNPIRGNEGSVTVDYTVSGIKKNEIFRVQPSFTSAALLGLNAKSFTGANSNIKPGLNTIVWNSEADKIVIDGKLKVKLKLYQTPQIPVGKHLLKSLLMPGLGDYRLRNGWGYFLITAGAYGSVGSAVYFNYSANNSYSNYLKSDDTGKRNDLFAQANNSRNYMYASIAAAATIWVVDVILVAVKASKVKKSLTEKSSKYYYKKFNNPLEFESEYEYVNSKTKYDLAIERGEDYLSEKSYEGARSAFLEAQKLKPSELLPEAKLAQIDKEVAAIQAKEEEFNKLMKEGNNLFTTGNYVAAKDKFNSALSIKSSDVTATAKLREIEKIEADKAKEAKYDDLMAKGNNALARKEYGIAIAFYTDAGELFPGRALPKTKAEEAEKLLEAVKTEKYKTKLAEAETALSNKEYTRAKMLFEEASAMKPYEEYPKNKIAMIEATLREASAGNNLPELYKKCKGAVFFVVFPGKESVSFGSGFFISEDGLALSNYHVFKGEARGTEIIWLEDDSKYTVSEVLDKNEEKDYIIFRVKKENSWQKFPFVPYSRTTPEIGDKVFAIGNPEGLEKTLSDGIVSGFHGDEDELIQITVPITHGSSGGPLFNMKGEVVGITTSGLDVGSLNFAVNIQLLKLSKYKKTITY